MTTDEKAFHIAAWRYDSPKENLLGYPVEPDMYYCIEFMWSIAKKVVSECKRGMTDKTKDIEVRRSWAPVAASITTSLMALDEEKLLDALYEAIVKLQEYEQNQPKNIR